MGNQINQAADTLHFSLLSCLQCPKCGYEKWVETSTSIDCEHCHQSYPRFDFGNITIPFVFADVNAATHAWCARINGFKNSVEQDIERISYLAKDKKTAN